jgi:hypothetical protein
MFRLRDKLNHTFSNYKLLLYRDYFFPFYNYLTEFKFKSNLKYIKDIIMPPKRKSTQQRPIDAIRELIEDQQLQINDLTEVVANQKLEIRELKAKWNARESIEREKKEAEEQKKLESSSWFFAARSSE